MADAISIQELIDARTDAKTLEEAVNGDAVTTVLSRLGETYPTLSNALSQIDGKLDSADAQIKQAITDLFQNGGLPATPFKTKALMTASALVDGKYAMVTDDTVNNGLYVKTAGAWVKSAYDPLAISKKYTEDVFRTNSNSQTLRFPDFNNVGGFYSSGLFNSTLLTRWRHTKHIRVVAGDVINATYFVSVSGYPSILFFDSTKKFVSNLVVSTGGDSYKTTTATVPSDGYVVFQHNLLDYNVTTKDTEAMRFELISTGARYLDYDNISEAVSHTPEIKQKADLIKMTSFGEGDWSLGYVDANGNDIDDSSTLRTIVYKLPAGTVVKINKPIGYGPQFGYSVSNNSKVTPNVIRWFTESSITFTVTEDKPYVRFFIRGTGTTLETANSIALATGDKVVYASDIDKAYGLPAFDSNFRDYTVNTGGFITIIDDDGARDLYTVLYPLMKSNNAPLGAAIAPGNIGKTHEGRPCVTLDELNEMAEDVTGFEVMNHSWTHGSQVGAPIEQKIFQIERSKQWFIENGFHNVTGFVYPYGSDDAESRNRVMRYYNAAYDYADGKILTPDNINNHLIKRHGFTATAEGLQGIKNTIDAAVAVNGWLVVTVHVGNPLYWFEDSYVLMQQLIDYANAKGMRFVLPKEGFQTYGNFLENSSGFRIQADGKIVGAS